MKKFIYSFMSMLFKHMNEESGHVDVIRRVAFVKAVSSASHLD